MYLKWSVDSFCPENFHLWSALTGLSVLAERRLWIDHGRYKVYPNTYTFFVSRPAVGKSTALDRLSSILKGVKGRGVDPRQGINFLAQQTSEAAFYKPQLTLSKEYYVGNEQLRQSPGFMCMPEAGNSLKEMSGGGAIFDALTEFYDCPNDWRKTLKNEDINLSNIAVSFLGACTFVSLPRIIPRQNLEGGLASRCIFVPEFDRKVREPAFRSEKTGEVLRQRLIDDAQDIFGYAGEMHVDESFQPEWSLRHAESDRALNKAPNSQIECMIARRFLIIEKLSMLCSLSKSSSKRITRDDWMRAEALYDAQAQHLPRLLEFSSVTDDQKTLTETIIRYVEDADGKCSIAELKRHLLDKGLDPFRIEANFRAMIDYNMLLVGPGNLVSVPSDISVDGEANVVAADGDNVQVEPLPTEVTHEGSDTELGLRT